MWLASGLVTTTVSTPADFVKSGMNLKGKEGFVGIIKDVIMKMAG